MMTEAKMKSTHGAKNDVRAVYITIGLEIGKVILQKIWLRVAPSMVAASSIAFGMVSKKPFAMK